MSDRVVRLLEGAFGPAHPEPAPGRYERLVRPTDVPARDVQLVLQRAPWPRVRGAWPIAERAAGYADRAG